MTERPDAWLGLARSPLRRFPAAQRHPILAPILGTSPKPGRRLATLVTALPLALTLALMLALSVGSASAQETGQETAQDSGQPAGQSAGTGEAATDAAPAPAAPVAAAPDRAVTTSSKMVAELMARVKENPNLSQRYDRILDNPIAPPDTRSPRATLSSFLLIMAEANRIWFQTRDRFLASSSISLSPEEVDDVARVHALMNKAAETMDLSQIPAASRQRATIELVLQLQEIFDRIYLPDLADIPGVGVGVAQKADSAALPEKWIIPGTSLTIARQMKGPDEGEYLFTAASVDRIPDDYATLEALPIVSDNGEDTYAYYIYTPGNLIPPQWYELILDGPDWLRLHFGGQTVWQWMGLFLVVAILLLAIVLYVRWNASRALPLSLSRRQMRSILHPVLLLVAVDLALYLFNEQINVTGELLMYLSTICSVVYWVTLAWLTYQVLQLIYIWALHNPQISRTSLDASLLRTGFRVLSLAVSIVVLGYGATQIGIPIYGVVAGLGVGGLAIALAAQPTLENFIGGLILYADGIVRVGEFCSFDDLSGTVEEIGIRSTRIRALDQTLIIVSNADLAKRKIVNYSRREAFMFRHRISLRYDTPAESIKAIEARLEAYLRAHDRVPESPLRVRLVAYANHAIEIDIYVNVIATSMDEFTRLQEDILYEIRSIVETEGARFAIPSQTLFLARDEVKRLEGASSEASDGGQRAGSAPKAGDKPGDEPGAESGDENPASA